MGDQQNPDGIYVPPGINRRFPLEPIFKPKPGCSCNVIRTLVRDRRGIIIDVKTHKEYNPECDKHGQIGIT